MEIPRLSNEEQAKFEHDLTVQEIKNVLHSFEKNKTPGEDGFSKEFYETFFDLLKQNLLDSYNEAFQKGSLSVFQRRGVISLIPKNDSDDTTLISKDTNSLKFSVQIIRSLGSISGLRLNEKKNLDSLLKT